MSRSAAQAIEAVLHREGEVHRDDLEGKTDLTREQVEAGLAIAAYRESPAGFLEPVSWPRRSGASKLRGIQPAHLEAEADHRAELARLDPGVQAFRREHVDGLLGDVAVAAEWIRTRESEPPFSDCLHYVSPATEQIQRAGTTPGDVLDQVREHGARLATRLDWHPAVATLFVLTDATPPLVVRSIAERVRITPELWVERSAVEARADDDPRAIGDAFAKHRGVRRRQAAPDRDRFAALRAFVDARPRATPSELFADWNSHCKALGRPAWRYSSVDKLRRGLKRASR